MNGTEPWVVAETLGVLEVLYAERNALERSPLSPLDPRLGGAGIGQQRLARPHRDEGDERRVHGLDAREGGLHQLDGRELAAPQQVDDFGQRTAQHTHREPPRRTSLPASATRRIESDV